MKLHSPNNASDKFQELRKSAEEILSRRENINNEPDLLDVKRLLTELQIYQIELEIQNEELRKTQVQLLTEREKYSDLYDFAPAAYFTFNDKGVIIELNLSAADLLGHTRKYLTNHPFLPYLSPASLPIFVQHIKSVLTSRKPQTCELTIRTNNNDQVTVHVNSVALSSDNTATLVRSVMSDISKLKRTEQKLLQSEEKFRRFFEQSNAGVAILDESGVVIEWNKALAEITTISKEQALGKAFLDIQTALLAPEQQNSDLLAQHKIMLDQALRSGEAPFIGKLIESQYRRADGAIRYIQQIVFPIKTPHGFQLGLLSYDITEQKLIQNELSDNHEKLESLMNSMYDAIYSVDAKTFDLIHTNPVITQIFGRPMDEFYKIGMAYVDTVHPEDRDIVNKSTEEIFERGEGEWIYRIIRPDGNVRWVFDRARLIIDEKGDPLRVDRMFTDITERKLAEEELQRWAHIFEHAEWGVTVCSADCKRIELMNPAFARMHGYHVDELMGGSLLLLFAPEVRKDVPGQIKIAHEKGHHVWESVHIRKDGSKFPVQIDVTAVPDNNGKILYRVLNVQDISTRKKTENLQQARLRILQFAAENSMEDLLQYTLDELCNLTESPIGFFHFVEPDQQTLSLQVWSTRTLEEFCEAEGKGLHYDINKAGVWVDCIREGRPVIHNNYAALQHRNGLPEDHAEIIREMVFPIIRSGKISAIIGVGNKEKEYQHDDVVYASQLADMIWDIADRKQAEEKLQESEERFRTLVNSMNDIVYTLDTQQRHTGVYGPWVEKSGLTPELYLGKSACDIFGPKLAKIHEDANVKALEGKTTVYEWSTTGESELLHFQTSVSPLRDADGKVYGIVGLGRDITERKRSEEAVQQANEKLEDRIKEIEKLQKLLKEQAIRDPLTDLYNRRYMQETLDREIARAKRENLFVSFIIIDIDHFKHINDNYGHIAGDKLLRTISNLIKENIRQGDIPCRYGGEEFLIVLPGAPTQVAQLRANKLREEVNDLYVEYNNDKMRVTISLGIATFPLHGSTGEETLLRADRALYQAKQGGRNRVSVFQDSLLTPHPKK